MPSNTQLTVIRTVATAVVTALTTLQVLYPSYTWIAAVVAASATLGIHAIPAIQQVTMKGNAMTDGLVAMGLKPAERTQQEPVATQVSAEPLETAVPESTPQTPDPVPVAPVVPDNTSARQALTDAANALLKIAESL